MKLNYKSIVPMQIISLCFIFPTLNLISLQLMTGSNEIIDLFVHEHLANLSLKALAELGGNKCILFIHYLCCH